jgi:uncharacterized glyoxalase superfamily protein PhnB
MQTTTAAYPRLIVLNAAEAITFYRDVFGAVEQSRHHDEQGRIVEARLMIGATRLSIRDEGYGDPAPPTLGGTPVILALELSDPDAVASAMVQRGATVLHPIADQPYGRAGRLQDPFGHQWMPLRPADG